MLLQKKPLHVLRQAINVRVHGRRVDAEVMEPSFAFPKAFAFNPDLEEAVAVILVVLKGNKLFSGIGFMDGEPSELGGYSLGYVIRFEHLITGSAERIAIFRGIDDIFFRNIEPPYHGEIGH